MHSSDNKTTASDVSVEIQGQHSYGRESQDIIADTGRPCGSNSKLSTDIFGLVFAQCLPRLYRGGTTAQFLTMRCNVLRFTISSLVVVLVVLQLIHLSMISWLENRTAKRRTSAIFPRRDGGGGASLGHAGAGGAGLIFRPESMGKTLKNPAQFRIPDAKLDTSGSYKIYPYYMKSATMDTRDVHKEYKDVTLVTQCSLHHLAHIVDLVDRWRGPLSVAIFGLASEVDTISTVMLTLRECYPGIKQNVSFHLVHPITEIVDGNSDAKETTLTKLPCESILPDLWERKLLTQNYAQEGIPYPNNLLRNVARAGTSSKFLLVIDIDMLPSANMRTGFLHLAHSSIILQEETEYSRKTSFVVPAYELRDGIPMPADKADLLESVRQENARQFYKKACSYCQNHTDYQKWENIQGSPGMLNIAYSVEWQPLWEPFYISHRDVPLYDERFKQYGFNRISQVCEMHVAGYNFVVLDTGFIVHKGFKEKPEFHARKDEENRRNKQLFFQLQSELEVKYPESSRRCQ
ncbi:beta-1,4-glucuronyltransferase 1-like [Amphiura filiformis]|uniref:beta-1,4-glucuronyltransferase 1-like n=1 Tax=Amphiura filiformis TaxID=82378 RepID=UPI003B227289